MIFCVKYTNLGIYSLIVGNITFPLVVFILNFLAIKRYIPGYKQEIVKTFIAPLSASLWMGAGTLVVYKLTGLITGANIIRTCVSLVVAIILYFILLLLLQTVTREEIVQFPFGYRMYAVAKKLRLMT